MHRHLRACLAFLLLSASAAFAHGILPASVSHWKSGAAHQFTAKNLNRIAGAATPALAEYGATAAETRTYRRGADSFVATVYSFADTSGAYGAYSFLRTPAMLPANFTKHSSISHNHALALTGNLLLEFTGRNPGRFHGAIEMLVAQAGGRAQWGVYPALPQRLPAADLVPRSDHYFLGPVALQHFLPLESGDWLGFSRGAEAELARYRLHGHEATLLIADYPTPQMAASQLKILSGQLNINGAQGGAKHGHRLGPALYARRDGTIVALLDGAPSKSSADALLAQVHLGMIVIWNAPILNLRQASMGTMIVGTIVGAGEICGFTLLGGIAFAGLRLLIKRKWPGKIFDREDNLQIIQLGLSSKPINAKDFY